MNKETLNLEPYYFVKRVKANQDKDAALYQIIFWAINIFRLVL